MKYQYFNDEKRILINFDDNSPKYTMSIFKEIKRKLSINRQIQYFIIISGLESTIDNFIEFCVSNNYKIYTIRRNFLIRSLPTLYLLSENWNDVVNFNEYIGSFNEGQMSLFFLDNNFEFNNINQLLSNVDKYCLLKIDIFGDGNELEITNGINDNYSEFEQIQILIQSWKDLK